jgi:hypothetical protein
MENRNTFHTMTKTVTEIPCPKNWESESDWDSHRPLLWLAVEHMDKKDAIYEFGCGFGSSPLLANTKRWFNSYETNKEWADKFVHTTPIDDYDHIKFPNGEWVNEVGVLFVDCAPGEIRKELINKWRNNAKVIVAHDSESGAEYVYHMAEVLSSFKYRLDYTPVGKPATTIVSETINVAEWL